MNKSKLLYTSSHASLLHATTHFVRTSIRNNFFKKKKPKNNIQFIVLFGQNLADSKVQVCCCCVIPKRSNSSAWTLPHDDDSLELVGPLWSKCRSFSLGALCPVLSLTWPSSWTLKREETGLWSENLDSPLTYHICFNPFPRHRMRSHLQINPN